MKRNVDDFIDEFTTNFSELFIDAFLLRYLDRFNKDKLLDTYKKTRVVLNRKLKINYLNKLGLSADDYKFL